ncbi:hypothetical protein SAMN05216404_103309 [Nitrosospira multiformis]|uniref:Uncharacterized protein n=1 Tax=Nitrosospira multiformis TaxID=1231 RepID=A0A1H8FGK5_9PROT|nr:hypothetical protein [Nitrosospira multiformis]SEN30218.1 hypothetical protein SAMN05216404_103309 [Nitrosospira multiformis]
MVDLTEPARLGGNFRLRGWKCLSGTWNWREFLLMDALSKALENTDKVAAVAVIVDANVMRQ